MNWYKKAQQNSVAYMFHGSGSQNLSSILSQGLSVDSDKLYDQDLTHKSIRSYGGIYFTDNLTTALSSARKSSDLSGEKKKSVITVSRIETKTPHVILDEDLFMSPHYCVQQSLNIIIDSSVFPEHLAYYIVTRLPEAIEEVSNCYISGTLRDRHPEIDDRALEGLKQYIPELVEAYCLNMLAAQIQTYYQGTLDYKKKYFEEQFPQFAGLDVATQEARYRDAADLIMHKGHRLTQDTENMYQSNVRSMEDVGYRGKNKIVLVAEFVDYKSKDKEYEIYHNSVDILYMSDQNALDKLLEEMTQRLGGYYIVSYKDNIIYDNPRNKVA